MHLKHHHLVPHASPKPKVSSTDDILASITNFVEALQSPTTNAPFAPLCDSHTKALHLLMDVLHAGVTTNAKSLRVPSKQLEYNSPRGPTKQDSVSPLPSPNKHKNMDLPPTMTELLPPEADYPPKSSSHPVHPGIHCITTTTMPLHNHPGIQQAAHVQLALAIPTLPSAAPQLAIHGSTFNPDTRELAEYTELSCSSNGHL